MENIVHTLLPVLLAVDLIFGTLAIVAVAVAVIVFCGYWAFELALRVFNLRTAVLEAYSDQLRRKRGRILTPKPESR